MADFNWIQSIDVTLGGSGVNSSQTTVDVVGFTLPDGTPITTAMLGTAAIGYGTFEPETTREENFSFTGVTDNGSNSYTLTGVTRGLKFVSPYDADATLQLPHSGSTVLRLTNSAPFYNEFSVKRNAETITGAKTFTQLIGTPTGTSSDTDKAASIEYVNSTVAAGVPDASTIVAGKVQEGTQAQGNDGTDTGSTGARLFLTPSKIADIIQSGRMLYFLEDGSGGDDAYTGSVTPAISSYATGFLYVGKITVANTGAATLELNSLGAKAIKKYLNAAKTDTETGDIIAGQMCTFSYDGTDVILLNPTGSVLAQSIVNQVNAFFAATKVQGLLTTFTSGEALAQGDVLGVTAADTVKRYSPTSLTMTFDKTNTVSSTIVNSSGECCHTGVLSLSSTLKAVSGAWNEAGSEKVQPMAVVVTPSTGVVDAPVVGASGSADATPSIVHLSKASSTLALQVVSSTNSILARIIDFSGSVTLGTEVTVDSTLCADGFGGYVSASHVLVIYRNTSTSAIEYVKYTLSGTTLTLSSSGTVTTLTGKTFTIKNAELLPGTTKFLITVQNQTDATAQSAIATYDTSGSTFSVGSWTNFPSDADLSTTDELPAAVACLSATQALIYGPTSATAASLWLATVSGTTVSFSSAVAAPARGSGSQYSLSAVNSRCALLGSVSGTTGTVTMYEVGADGTSVSARVSGTSTDSPADGTIESGFGYFAFSVSPTRFGALTFRGSTDDAWTGTSLYVLPTVAGIATSSVSSSASEDVLTEGYCDDVSGLTAATRYYADVGGTVTTNSNGNPPKVLVAKDSGESLVRIVD